LRCWCVCGSAGGCRRCIIKCCSGLISAIALLLFARAIGDSNLVGFFKEIKGSRFARLGYLGLFAVVCGVGGGVVGGGVGMKAELSKDRSLFAGKPAPTD
jgi:hypothetical protein